MDPIGMKRGSESLRTATAAEDTGTAIEGASVTSGERSNHHLQFLRRSFLRELTVAAMGSAVSLAAASSPVNASEVEGRQPDKPVPVKPVQSNDPISEYEPPLGFKLALPVARLDNAPESIIVKYTFNPQSEASSWNLSDKESQFEVGEKKSFTRKFHLAVFTSDGGVHQLSPRWNDSQSTGFILPPPDPEDPKRTSISPKDVVGFGLLEEHYGPLRDRGHSAFERLETQKVDRVDYWGPHPAGERRRPYSFSLTSAEGTSLTPENLAEKKVVVLKATSITCNSCMLESIALTKWMNELPRELQGKVAVVELSHDDPKDSSLTQRIKRWNHKNPHPNEEAGWYVVPVGAMAKPQQQDFLEAYQGHNFTQILPQGAVLFRPRASEEQASRLTFVEGIRPHSFVAQIENLLKNDREITP